MSTGMLPEVPMMALRGIEKRVIPAYYSAVVMISFWFEALWIHK